MLTVLLTDAAFTGLIRTLRAGYGDDVRIVGLSTDENTAHLAFVDVFYLVPSHRDHLYINTLMQICRQEKVDVIFPIITDGLEDIAANAERIRAESGARVLISSLSSLRIANDKGNLYEFLKHCPDESLQKLVPLYFTADTKSSLFEDILALQAQGIVPCIKRRRGEDAAGFFLIDNDMDYSSMIYNGKVGKRISVDLLQKMLEQVPADQTIPDFLVSEYLPGEEWDVDVLCREGVLLSATTRRNISMYGGLTSVLETKDNPPLVEFCRAIVSVLGLSYIACISFRARADGTYCLLEINPRTMGNIYVSTLCGNNYVTMSIDLLYGKDVHPTKPKSGIRTALYYDQLRIDECEVKRIGNHEET